jgi:hypothetical protein
LLIDFEAGESEDGGSFAEHYVSWSDIRAILDLQSAKYADSVAAGRQAIAADRFEDWCFAHGYEEDRMFVNLIPMLSSACSRCIGAISQYIEPESVEAEAFLNIFQNVQPADFDCQEYVELTSAVFWPT